MTELLSIFQEHEQAIYIAILSILIGVEVISKVPQVLHTPLMSGSNALSGVVIIGSIIVLGSVAPDNWAGLAIGFVSVVLATVNVVGGFAVTGRMLEMFNRDKGKRS